MSVLEQWTFVPDLTLSGITQVGLPEASHVGA
jgi:hypothetical protein